MKEDLISVIIPVYQAEQYLSSTIESILCQTYCHWELILVDDGSKDGSGQICDEYAMDDSRIRVFHQPNQGVSAARNLGIQMAQGAYIAFVDSDDLVREDYLEVLYRDMVEQNVEFVCCNAVEEYQGVQRDYRVVNAKRRIDSSHCRETCYQDFMLGRERYVRFNCCKLIKTDLVKRHPYRLLRYGEDTLFVMELLSDAPAVYLDDYPGYIYIRRDDSATFKYGARYVPNFMDSLVSSQYLFQSTQELSEQVRRMATNYHAYSIHTAAAATVTAGRESYSSQRGKLLEYIRELKPCDELLSTKSRLRLRLYEYIPAIYWLCIKLLVALGRA